MVMAVSIREEFIMSKQDIATKLWAIMKGFVYLVMSAALIIVLYYFFLYTVVILVITLFLSGLQWVDENRDKYPL